MLSEWITDYVFMTDEHERPLMALKQGIDDIQIARHLLDVR